MDKRTISVKSGMEFYLSLTEMLLQSKPRRRQQPKIAHLVRALPHTMQLAQAKFADALGMMFATLKRGEKGRATPSLARKQLYPRLHQRGDEGEVLRTKDAPKN
jgi:DNA-binding transcriptional regulator YiaG